MIGARLFAMAVAALPISNGISPSFAQEPHTIAVYMTGEYLTSTCREYLVLARNAFKGVGQTLFDAAQCQGFVRGVLDVMWMHPSISQANEYGIPKSCVPLSLKLMDATEIVAQFADKHPEQRDATGYVIVRRAFAQAFPCR